MKGKAKDLTRDFYHWEESGENKNTQNRAKRIITPLWGTTEWGKKGSEWGYIFGIHTLFFTITIVVTW